MMGNADVQWLASTMTIAGGVVIFVVGQAVLKLFIEPVQHLKATIGSISNTLLRRQAAITNGTQDAELSAKMFDHAAELVSKAEVILCYRLVAFLFRLPLQIHVLKAARELNSIAHETMDRRPPGAYFPSSPSVLSVRRNSESLKRIAELLRVRTDY